MKKQASNSNSTLSNNTLLQPIYTKTSLIFVCIAIILLAVNMRTPIVMIGSIAPMIEYDLAIGETQIGWLGALPMLMFAFGALISSRMSNIFGVHNLLPVMLGMLTVGMVLRVLILDWWLFFAGTLLLSLAIGFLNTIVMPAIKQLAPTQIPLVTGLYSFTMTVFAGLSAGLIVPMSNIMGWQSASAIWAVISIFALIIWVKLRPTLSQHQTHSQTDFNITTVNQSIHTQQALNPPSMWRLPMAWYLAIFLGIQSLMYYFLASFLPSIWMDKGLNMIQAGQIAMLFQLMSPIAIILLTWLMNKVNSHSQPNIQNGQTLNQIKDPASLIAVIASIIITVGIVGMTFGPYENYNATEIFMWANIWTVCLGLGASLVFTLSLMLISLRTYDTKQAGELSSMAQSVAYTIAIFGPLGAGWLHETTSSWQPPLIILAVLMTINIIFAWLASRNVMIDGKC